METRLSAVDAARRAGITYRQLDYYARLGLLEEMCYDAGVSARGIADVGSGRRRSIPTAIIPRLRLIGRLQRGFGSGVNTDVLRQVTHNYRLGSKIFDGFALSWRVEDE